MNPNKEMGAYYKRHTPDERSRWRSDNMASFCNLANQMDLSFPDRCVQSYNLNLSINGRGRNSRFLLEVNQFGLVSYIYLPYGKQSICDCSVSFETVETHWEGENNRIQLLATNGDIDVRPGYEGNGLGTGSIMLSDLLFTKLARSLPPEINRIVSFVYDQSQWAKRQSSNTRSLWTSRMMESIGYSNCNSKQLDLLDIGTVLDYYAKDLGRLFVKEYPRLEHN